MISEVIIKNSSKSPIRHLDSIDALKSGTKITFTDGINIVVGKNGSGKSTLLELISQYCLCKDAIYSNLESTPHHLFSIVSKKKKDFLNGVDIKADYKDAIFRLRPKSDYGYDEQDSSFEAFASYATSISSSVGEQTIIALNSLFKVMFSGEVKPFPIKEIEAMIGNVNEVWESRFSDLLNYYKRNRIKSGKVTCIMDEPDRNLDIDNLEHIYGILSYEHPQVQIIAVIHNPALIKKLSRLPYINFIELTEGYLNKVLEF